MRTGTRRQRHYDHRLRDLVFRTGDATIATDLGVPRSTVAGWLIGDVGPVVSLDVLDLSTVDLQAEVVKLRRRVETLRAVVCLLVRLRRLPDFRLERTRVSDPSTRANLLRAAGRAERVLPRKAVLKVLGISPARYARWKRRERGCDVPDESTCIRSTPTRLTADETTAIRKIATDERYRHVPTSRLLVLAEQLGEVFASPTTWYRLVRERQWSRPRLRRHPKPPKEGIRASGPDQIWHIDTSQLRLADGTKVWLHAVVDNFSRRVLAWRASDRFAIESAVSVLEEAAASAVTRDVQPELIADGGVEHAQAPVALSPPAGFGSRGAAPRGFLRGRVQRQDPACGISRQTPDETYYGRGERIPIELEAARKVARARRLAVNRAASCGRCASKSEVAA